MPVTLATGSGNQTINTDDFPPGEEFIILSGTTGNITFTGSNNFFVTMNEDLNGLADNSRVIAFGAGTDPTVNIGSGVDTSQYQFNADGDSLAINLGTGATSGAINADSVNGPLGTFDLTAGDNVTVIGPIDGPNATSATNFNIGNNFTATSDVIGSAGADNTMIFLDNLTVTGRLTASGTGDTILTVGNTSSIGNSLDLRGSGDRTATFGNDATITGNLDVRSSGTHSVTFGDRATVTADVNFSGALSAFFQAGDDFAVGINFVTSEGDDFVVVGDNWDIGNAFNTLGGDDAVRFGFQSAATTTSFTGSTGTDGLTVTADPTDPAGFTAAAVAAGYTDNGDGTVSAAPGAGSFSFSGVTYSSFETAGPVCFTAGTRITMADGQKANVEDLRNGDLVMTADHGPQKVRWTNQRTLSAGQLRDHMRPIRIAAHALGCGLPAQDLLVSPQHRMLVRSQIVQKMTGAKEVLVAAKHLLGLSGIEVAHDLKDVTYIHFLCDRHEIVFANNAPSETLHTGPQALKSLPAAAKSEIFDLFPELADLDYRACARPIIQGHKARNMAARHKKNEKSLIDDNACAPSCTETPGWLPPRRADVQPRSVIQ